MIRAALLLGLLAVPVAAEVTHVRAGRLLDVERGRVLTDQMITIDGERIVAIGPWRGAPVKGVVTDWSRKLVLPGLIDLHTHLSDWEQTNNPAEPLLHSEAEIAEVGAKHALATLRAGFTTVRDVGTFRAFSDVRLRDRIAAGAVPGPRMHVVGAYVTAPGGGGTITGLAPDVEVPAAMRRGVVRDAADVRRVVRELFDGGVDGIKLIATGAVLSQGAEPGAIELSEEQMRAAVGGATARGGWVVAHAHGAEGIKAAIRAGVRVIEHASLIDDAGLALAKARGVVLDMDIYNGDWIEEVGTREGWPPAYLRKNRETTDAQRAAFAKAVRLGVRLTFGTDAGVYPHGRNARQLAYMVRYGMTSMQAIASATIRAAEALGTRDVGAVAVGRFADLVAVDGDALADIRLLEGHLAVMKGGRLIAGTPD